MTEPTSAQKIKTYFNEMPEEQVKEIVNALCIAAASYFMTRKMRLAAKAGNTAVVTLWGFRLVSYQLEQNRAAARRVTKKTTRQGVHL